MRTLILIAGLVSGIPILVSSFAAIPAVSKLAQEFQRWGIILAGFSTFLGVINLTLVNVASVKRTKKPGDKAEPVVLLGIMWLLVAVGVFAGQSNPAYAFLFEYALKPLSASGFAMLAFFIASAAYRAFRVRNADAALLLVCGSIVMVANTPVGKLVWSGFPTVSAWIVSVVNGGAMKGVVIGGAVGAIITSLKVLVGIERSHLRG